MSGEGGNLDGTCNDGREKRGGKEEAIMVGEGVEERGGIEGKGVDELIAEVVGTRGYDREIESQRKKNLTYYQTINTDWQP